MFAQVTAKSSILNTTLDYRTVSTTVTEIYDSKGLKWACGERLNF